MYLRAGVFVFVGLAIGLSLADIDQVFFFLRHRSIVTHGILLPYLAYLLVKQPQQSWLRMGVVGLSIGMAIHLGFDLFPASWRGFALLYAPLFGSLGPVFSRIWVIANIVACLYLALLMVKHKQELWLCLLVGIVGSFIAWQLDRATTLWPLFTLVVCCGITTLLPNDLIDGRKVAQRTISKIRSS